MDKITRLQKINTALDHCFDDDKKRGLLGKTLETVGASGVVGGAAYGRGVLADRANNVNKINSTAFTLSGASGLGKNMKPVTSGYNTGVIPTMSRGLSAFGGDAKSAWTGILAKLAKLKR